MGGWGAESGGWQLRMGADALRTLYPRVGDRRGCRPTDPPRVPVMAPENQAARRPARAQTGHSQGRCSSTLPWRRPRWRRRTRRAGRGRRFTSHTAAAAPPRAPSAQGGGRHRHRPGIRPGPVPRDVPPPPPEGPRPQGAAPGAARRSQRAATAHRQRTAVAPVRGGHGLGAPTCPPARPSNGWPRAAQTTAPTATQQPTARVHRPLCGCSYRSGNTGTGRRGGAHQPHRCRLRRQRRSDAVAAAAAARRNRRGTRRGRSPAADRRECQE